ncbi:hypothetical protein RJ55_08270 [Drechmeria coniospora]|nr:hypothetical protein RJ55_08270 [Drechmeria coniospora]
MRHYPPAFLRPHPNTFGPNRPPPPRPVVVLVVVARPVDKEACVASVGPAGPALCIVESVRRPLSSPKGSRSPRAFAPAASSVRLLPVRLETASPNLAGRHRRLLPSPTVAEVPRPSP